jgi:hypothetical protein
MTPYIFSLGLEIEMTREFIIEDSAKLSWNDRQALVVAIATYNTGIDLLPVWEHIEKCPRIHENDHRMLPSIDLWSISDVDHKWRYASTAVEIKEKMDVAFALGINGAWLSDTDLDKLVRFYGIEVEMRNGIAVYTRSRRRCNITRYIPLDIKNPQIVLPTEGHCMLVWDNAERLALLQNTEWEQHLQDIASLDVW